MKSPRVEVHIDALVLHGFEARDATALSDALREELGRAFAASIPEPQARDVGRVDAGFVRVRPEARTRAVASAAARAIRAAAGPERRTG